MSALTAVPGFVPVKNIEPGGEGIPAPYYRGVFGGETLYVFTKGQGRRAIEWLTERGPGFALIAVCNGVEREVARIPVPSSRRKGNA